MMEIRNLICTSLLMTSFSAFCVEYRIGLALGYPPYQYTNSKNEPVGIDYDVAKLVFEHANIKVRFIQDQWENLLYNLYHQLEVDGLCGAEITTERKAVLEFSKPYYKRKIVLFTLKDSKVKKISDLYEQVITGDVHSSFEKYLGKNRENIRVMKTKSKEDSFLKLKEKSVVAVIAPLEVGHYLSKKLHIQTRVIESDEAGTPVAFAFSKGSKELILKVNKSLEELMKNGKIQAILKKNYN